MEEEMSRPVGEMEGDQRVNDRILTGNGNFTTFMSQRSLQ